MTKTKDIIFTTAGAIKHDYTSKEVCTLCNRYLRVCYVKTYMSSKNAIIRTGDLSKNV